MTKKRRPRTGREIAQDYIESRGGEDQFIKEAMWDDLFEMKPLWWNLSYDNQMEFFMELREVLDPNWREFVEGYPPALLREEGTPFPDAAEERADKLKKLTKPFNDNLPVDAYEFLTYVDSALEYLQDCGEIPMRSFQDTLGHIEGMPPEDALCYTRGLLSMRSRRYQNPIWTAPGEEDASFHPHDRWRDWQWRFIAEKHAQLRKQLLQTEETIPRMQFLWHLSDDSAFWRVRDFFWNLPYDEADGMIFCPLNQQDFGYFIKHLVLRGGMSSRKDFFEFACACIKPHYGIKEGSTRSDRYAPKNMSKQVSPLMNRDDFPLVDSLLDRLVVMLPKSAVAWRASPELMGEGAPNLPSV